MRENDFDDLVRRALREDPWTPNMQAAEDDLVQRMASEPLGRVGHDWNRRQRARRLSTAARRLGPPTLAAASVALAVLLAGTIANGRNALNQDNGPLASRHVDEAAPPAVGTGPAASPVPASAATPIPPTRGSDPAKSPADGAAKKVEDRVIDAPTLPLRPAGRCAGKVVGDHKYAAAVLRIYYEPSSGENCARLTKTRYVGKKTYLRLTLCNRETRQCDRDWNYYSQTAGPVRVQARAQCVTWTVAALDPRSTKWALPETSGTGHCG